MNKFKSGNDCSCLCVRGCNKVTDKLNSYDWLADLPDNAQACDIVEIQFKAPRKGYFLNSNKLSLEKGDVVAVEANQGHDIGTVTMTGRLVMLQIRKANLKPDYELKRIYRKARPVDIEKYEEAKSREHATMIESRQIAKNLGLKMKIGDVEYQGDGNKAIFYYIADERVDFRQLIKVLAERFRVRIEMKQIGARQEAGRIGGIGPCGRELCCATWMTNFISVSTSAARFQDISLNPQKLAGQCAKLKCCLNYEVDQYVESLKRMPSREISLFTEDNEYFFFKADILRHKITYSTDKHLLANEITISAKRAFDVIEMNKRGEKPESLSIESNSSAPKSSDLLDQENINRFDSAKKKKKKKNQNGGKQNQQNDSKKKMNVQNDAPNGQAPKEEQMPKQNNGNGQQQNPKENKANDRQQRPNNDQNRQQKQRGQGNNRHKDRNRRNNGDATDRPSSPNESHRKPENDRKGNVSKENTPERNNEK